MAAASHHKTNSSDHNTDVCKKYCSCHQFLQLQCLHFKLHGPEEGFTDRHPHWQYRTYFNFKCDTFSIGN